ncbi:MULTISPECIES: effector-associated constant component EACC1 [Nocardia]|uniref:effector-associated constant component EACC1 n=1 Tax=Nocardia TaxID=1817 RepID=UPI0013003C58|nr:MULTISPECIES: hypothetical protein [Nocardia]
MPNLDEQVQIHTDGGPEAAEQLMDWLRDEDALRGLVRLTRAPIREGDLGGVAEILTVVVTGGATVTALARTLTTWLTHRRSDLNLTITRGEVSVKIDGKRLDAKTVLRQIQELTGPATPPQ